MSSDLQPEDAIPMNPVDQKNLIGKKVKVLQSNNKTYEGYVYCVDPVSQSIVLVNQNKFNYKTDILLGYTIKKIDVLSEEVNTDVIFQAKSKEANIKNEERRRQIKDWLVKNLINVEEDGDELKIMNDLIIFPPYEMENCISTNTIILERIQKILSQMPVE